MPDVQVKLIKCQQCSATLHPRPGQPLMRCAFCGSSYLVEGMSPAGEVPAVRWLPFSVEAPAARAMVEAWLSTGFFRPGDLAQAATVHEPAAVLVPLYLGRARAHSNWTAEVVRQQYKKIKTVLPPGVEVKTGDGVTMRADSHLLSGAHDAEYENVFLLASRGLSESAFSEIANYDWARLEPMPGGADVATEEPTVATGEAMRQLRHRMEDAERDACRRMVPGQVADLRVNTVIQDLRVDLVYVPVWVVGYTYAGRPYRALVNGMTTRAGGEAPVSVPRAAIAVASLIALPAAIAWWLWRRRRG